MALECCESNDLLIDGIHPSGRDFVQKVIIESYSECGFGVLVRPIEVIPNQSTYRDHDIGDIPGMDKKIIRYLRCRGNASRRLVKEPNVRYPYPRKRMKGDTLSRPPKRWKSRIAPSKDAPAKSISLKEMGERLTPWR